ncbi:MAG TPA: carboxypeptidase regulatory-like domain-containing protein [Bryobacteraceae bacterium]|nr:carboxypeptidase regulatory-like domain-containing protein [Bryobacteraceae bacterium]
MKLTTLILLITAAPFVYGQEQLATASIDGTVRDSTGAVLPDVPVTLTNTQTGVRKTIQTGVAGSYSITNIPPGTYTLQVSKEGFTTQTREALTLYVDQRSTFDFTLSVGTSAQNVTVEAAGAALQTASAEVGTVIESRSVNDLPLNGRNFSQLLTLTPGVSPVNVSQSNGGGHTNAYGTFVVPSVNGQPNRSNLFLLDGVNNVEVFSNTFIITPIVDDIQEFKLGSHNDEAQFGGVMGGIVNVVTKSGTNSFHGAAWEFLRNSAFDARDPFFAKVNPLRQNQFGANAGGPVILPHYNGRNHTFFFGSYEGLRISQANQSLGLVPTPAEISGNLSDISSPIYNPFSTRPDPNNPGQYLRDPFPNNQIPANLLNPLTVAYAKAVYPSPLVTGVPGTNSIDTSPATQHNNEYNLRGDEYLNDKNILWFRFSHINTPETTSPGLVGFTSITGFAGYNLGTAWTHTFGPSAVLQVQFGRNWGVSSPGVFWTGGNTSQLLGQLGYPAALTSQFTGSRSSLLPLISIPGYLGAGESSNAPDPVADVYEFKADFTQTLSRHTLHLGGNYETNLQPGLFSNDFSTAFAARQTSNLEAAGIVTGSSLASFLLGVPDSAQFISQENVQQHGGTFGIYGQDQWRATDRLTINIGLRWDAVLVPTFGRASDLSNTVGDLNLNNGTYILQNNAPSCATTGKAPCIPGGTLPANVLVASNGRILKNIYDNIQPRVGLAYRLSQNTVIRASYGRFYDDWAAMLQEAGNLGGHWPTATLALANNLNQTTPTAAVTNPFGGTPQSLPAPTPFKQVAWFDDPYFKNPYSDQWNFGIQQLLGKDTILTTNYVGSHNSRTDVAITGNAATVPGPGPVSARTPYSYITPTFYDKSIGRATYNALQVSVNRKTSKGLTYLLSYTYSKVMDIGSDGWFCAEGCNIEDPYYIDNNKSVAGYDLTNMFTGSFVYDLPIGRGRRFTTGNRAADYILGNWQLNGIVTYTSGVPFTVNVSGDIANTGNLLNYERPNLVGNPIPANQGPSEWLNPSAFSVPAAFTFGNLGRNTFRGDPLKDFDFSLFRDFPFSESRRLQFRFDAFNLTNTPTWGSPQAVLNAANFGEITATRSTARELQLSLKLYF